MKKRFTLQLVERRVEDGTTMFLMTDGTWTAKSRGDVEGVREFGSLELATAEAQKMTYNRGEKVFVDVWGEKWYWLGDVQIKPLNRFL